ncbi:MAG: hypothetical protein GY733_05785, partial [bacterium]|nr:hypothetical protein [bacterium]
MDRVLARHGVVNPVPTYNVSVPGARGPVELAVELPSDRFRHEIAARGLLSVCLGNTGGRLRRRMAGFRNEAAPDEQVERLIPMKIHADGVKVTNRRKMFVIDVSPAAGDN